MQFLIIVIVSLIFPNKVDHDIPLTTFHLHQANNKTHLDITFDIEDLATVLEVSANKITLKKIETYLNRNTSWVFDSEKKQPRLLKKEIKNDHLIITSIFQNINTTIHQISIDNTCLNSVEHHSNIIKIDLQNETMDYRMHSERTSICVML